MKKVNFALVPRPQNRPNHSWLWLQLFSKIFFPLDNCLINAVYKKKELIDYDATTYVNLIGQNNFKVYLQYRPYMREMLAELKPDFELVLFSTQGRRYIERIAKTIEKDERFFDFYIAKEELFLIQDIQYNVIDLEVLFKNRDPKDIIVLANSCGKYMFQITNGLPLKEFHGNKKDVSLYSATKYLKTLKDVSDVRQKLAEDFGINT